MLPDEDVDAFYGMMRDIIDDPNVEVVPEPIYRPESPPSPVDNEMFETLENVANRMYPDATVLPRMSTGATDGLYLRNAGIPTYGVSGIFEDVEDNRAHGQDERVGVKQFFEGQEFLYRLVKELSSP